MRSSKRARAEEGSTHSSERFQLPSVSGSDTNTRRPPLLFNAAFAANGWGFGSAPRNVRFIASRSGSRQYVDGAMKMGGAAATSVRADGVPESSVGARFTWRTWTERGTVADSPEGSTAVRFLEQLPN